MCLHNWKSMNILYFIIVYLHDCILHITMLYYKGKVVSQQCNIVVLSWVEGSK